MKDKKPKKEVKKSTKAKAEKKPNALVKDTSVHNPHIVDVNASPKPRYGGRPSRYDPTHHPKVCEWMRRDGKSSKEIALEFGVSQNTIYHWVEKYPAFCDAFNVSRDAVDKLVENALLKKCLGYDESYIETYEEREALIPKAAERLGISPDDIDNWIVVKRKVMQKRLIVPPDVNAIKFWLINRKGSEYKSEKVAHNHSGAEDGKPISVKPDLTGLSMDELKALEVITKKIKPEEEKKADSKSND